MKRPCILLLVMLLLSTALQAQAPLSYRLTMDPNVMHVALTYTPVTTDSTAFKYGNEFYGGMKDLLKGLVNLKASVPFRVDSVASTLTFYHPKNTSITIKYDIIDTHTPDQRVIGEMFRPIITDSYFFSLSHTLFLNPILSKKLQDSMKMSVTLIEKPAFPMYLSFAPELQPGETVLLSLEAGMDALVTGAANLHVEKRDRSGIKNYVVLQIDPETRYNLHRFMTYFDVILPAMTDFWGTLNGTYYSLVASPFLDIEDHSISGTSFLGGFHVKYSGDTILANDQVMITISHEIMHRYIGTTITLDQSHQWFNEGFTDYTTWLILSRCGLISSLEFQELIESTYNKLDASPVKNTPNGEIAGLFWKSHDYEHLPYMRGALFAAWISQRINEEGRGTYQGFMRSLKVLAEQRKETLTLTDFIEVASTYLTREEIEASLQHYIINGEMIPREYFVH